jgi:hypothetical protein
LKIEQNEYLYLPEGNDEDADSIFVSQRRMTMMLNFNGISVSWL